MNPQQKVVLDGSVLVDFVMEAPDDPRLAVVESWVTGPLVVDKGRLTLVA